MMHRKHKGSHQKGVPAIPAHAARDVQVAGIRANNPEDDDLTTTFTQGVESVDGQGLCNNFELMAHGHVRGVIIATAQRAVMDGQSPDKIDYAEAAYRNPAAIGALHQLLRVQILGKTTPIVDVPIYRGSLNLVEATKTIYRQIRRVLPADQRATVTFPKAITLRMVGVRPPRFSGPEVSAAEALVKVELASEKEIADLEARIEAAKAAARAARQQAKAASTQTSTT